MVDEVDPQILQDQMLDSTILDDFFLEGRHNPYFHESNHSLETSDIHVWDHALPLNDMKQWTSCK